MRNGLKNIMDYLNNNFEYYVFKWLKRESKLRGGKRRGWYIEDTKPIEINRRVYKTKNFGKEQKMDFIIDFEDKSMKYDNIYMGKEKGNILDIYFAIYFNIKKNLYSLPLCLDKIIRDYKLDYFLEDLKVKETDTETDKHIKYIIKSIFYDHSCLVDLTNSYYSLGNRNCFEFNEFSIDKIRYTPLVYKYHIEFIYSEKDGTVDKSEIIGIKKTWISTYGASDGSNKPKDGENVTTYLYFSNVNRQIALAA